MTDDWNLSDKIFRYESGNTKHGNYSKNKVSMHNSQSRVRISDIKDFLKKVKGDIFERSDGQDLISCGEIDAIINARAGEELIK